MLTISGLGADNPAYDTCVSACIDALASTKDQGAYFNCTNDCYNAYAPPGEGSIVTSLPPGTLPTTNLPSGLAPPPGYQKQTPVNWWRIGIGVALGLGVLAVFWSAKHSARGADHAA